MALINRSSLLDDWPSADIKEKAGATLTSTVARPLRMPPLTFGYQHVVIHKPLWIHLMMDHEMDHGHNPLGFMNPMMDNHPVPWRRQSFPMMDN